MDETLVGVVMGSDSDWEVMRHAAEQLKKFNIPFEAKVVSAHRTPDLLYRYAQGAAGRGLACIIAGAGGAAHLPGMLAAGTTVPVLGVPVPAGHLQGLDALLSIANAQGRTGGHLRHRRRGCGERGIVRGGVAGAHG